MPAIYLKLETSMCKQREKFIFPKHSLKVSAMQHKMFKREGGKCLLPSEVALKLQYCTEHFKLPVSSLLGLICMALYSQRFNKQTLRSLMSYFYAAAR